MGNYISLQMHETIDLIMTFMKYKQGSEIHYEVQFDIMSAIIIPQNPPHRKTGCMTGIAPYNCIIFWPKVYGVLFSVHLPYYKSLSLKTILHLFAKYEQSFA